MRDSKYSARFKRDLKKYEHQHEVVSELNAVLKMLLSGLELPQRYRDHRLTGNYVEYRECHIRPDVLLIYKATERLLYLYRLGSHSELF